MHVQIDSRFEDKVRSCRSWYETSKERAKAPVMYLETSPKGVIPVCEKFFNAALIESEEVFWRFPLCRYFQRGGADLFSTTTDQG